MFSDSTTKRLQCDDFIFNLISNKVTAFHDGTFLCHQHVFADSQQV